MQSDISHYINNVCECVKQKRPAHQLRCHLQSITTFARFELNSVDCLHMDNSSGGCETILVIMNQFTKYSKADPTRNKSAKTAAEKIFNNFILQFSFPLWIHHDQGVEFENHLLQSWKHSLVSSDHARVHITQRAMARWRDSMPLCSQCCSSASINAIQQLPSLLNQIPSLRPSLMSYQLPLVPVPVYSWIPPLCPLLLPWYQPFLPPPVSYSAPQWDWNIIH